MKIKTNYENRLPHIAPIGATFFVTFRLADSLPLTVINKLRTQRDQKILALEQKQPTDYQLEIIKTKKRFFKQYDERLDINPMGTCYLKQPEIAAIVKAKLHEFDGVKYHLLSYCIMSNHVHVLFDTSQQIRNKARHLTGEIPENYMQLHEIMRLIKGSTAYNANKLLGKKGKFWMKDSYDHFIRNERERLNVINYILNNPVKAKIVANWQDYPHTYCTGDFSRPLLNFNLK